MTEIELDNWEKQLGFVSLRTIMNQAYLELNEAKTRADIDKIVTANKCVFKLIKNNQNEDEIIEIIKAPVYLAICNSKGIFIENEKVTKVTRTYTLQTNVKNISKIETFSDDNIESFQNKKEYSICKYILDENIEELNPSDKGSDVTESLTKYHGLKYHENNRRRCYIDFSAVNLRGTSADYKYTISTYYSIVSIYGKKRVLGVYYRYNTDLTLFNASFGVARTDGLNWPEVSLSTINADDTREIKRSYYYGTISTLIPNWTPTMYYSSYNGKATSRGIGTETVEISF